MTVRARRPACNRFVAEWKAGPLGEEKAARHSVQRLRATFSRLRARVLLTMNLAGACQSKSEKTSSAPDPIQGGKFELFVQVFFLFFLYGSDNAKKSVGLVADPGCEIKPIIKKVESPESVEI